MECKNSLPECLGQQLEEIELLQSMFPNEEEFVCDPFTIEDIKSFIDSKSKDIPTTLEYSIALSTCKGLFSVNVTLPHKYPNEHPDVYVRSDHLTRNAQTHLNDELDVFLKDHSLGDLLIGEVIVWLQEHADEFIIPNTEGDVEKQPCLPTGKKSRFARWWIYSHHIYSKVKRKEIKELSEEFQLKGFCLPGKPGIICVEGLEANVCDWWHRVRSWNWQKIVIKKQEFEDMKPDDNISQFARFPTFKELSSEDVRIKSSGFHVDMGDVFQFLEKHNSGYIYEEYFGFSGR